MKKKKSKKVDLSSSGIYEQDSGKHSAPMICNACPLVYIMRITDFNQFSDIFKDASIYLNPLIED